MNMEEDRPGHIIIKARKQLGLTQAKFAEKLRTRQSLLSKYESGQIDPPSHVIIHCMNIIKTPAPMEDVSLQSIISRLKKEFSGSDKSAQRVTLNLMLTTLAPLRSTSEK